MARRKPASADRKAQPEPVEAAPSGGGGGGGVDRGGTFLASTPLRVLIVSPSKLERLRLAARLCDARENAGVETGVGSCEHAESARSAIELIDADHFDLVLIRSELPDGSGLELARRLSSSHGSPAAIILAESPTLEQAVAAMRCGAADLLAPSACGGELASAVRQASARARAQFDQQARIARLTRVCNQLNRVRQEITAQVSSMCGDLVNAYEELSGQVVQMSVASEFAGLIRQELDVETLLRTALEFVLAKVGPTNAAIYLPSNSQDYSLGAYVNYDQPKETADVLLETMAGVLPPRMERCKELRAFNQRADLSTFLGEHAHWFDGQCLVTFACHHDGECLAVIALFRDTRTPFTEAMLPVFRTIAELFGRQLARVIHIHHRHLPKDKWGGFGGGDEDEGDGRMAA